MLPLAEALAERAGKKEEEMAEVRGSKWVRKAVQMCMPKVLLLKRLLQVQGGGGKKNAKEKEEIVGCAPDHR